MWLATPAARGRQILNRAHSLESPSRQPPIHARNKRGSRSRPQSTRASSLSFARRPPLEQLYRNVVTAAFPSGLLSLRPMNWFHRLREPLLGRNPRTGFGNQTRFCRSFSANPHSGSGHLRQRHGCDAMFSTFTDGDLFSDIVRARAAIHCALFRPPARWCWEAEMNAELPEPAQANKKQQSDDCGQDYGGVVVAPTNRGHGYAECQPTED
jgi:hypothetical protein